MTTNGEDTSAGSPADEPVTVTKAGAAAGSVTLPRVFGESDSSVRGYERWYKKEIDALNIPKHKTGFCVHF